MRTFFFASVIALFLHPFFAWAQLTIVNVTEPVFRHPESAVYDAKRNCVYISNMDKDTPDDSLYTDFISKIKIDGTVAKLHYIDSLSSPSGLALYRDHLYAVERNAIAKIDLENLKTERFPVPATGFLNDIAIDTATGTIYVSETSPEGKIYSLNGSVVKIWIQDTLLANTNGLLIRGNTLLAGVNGDGYLKSVDLNTRQIEKLLYLGAGNIDGIQDANGILLVSHFLGNLYAINSRNEVKELLNTRDQEIFIADFAFIPVYRRIIIPSLRTNKVYIYSYGR